MIETLANWGEFLGGVAVVISLVYVGVQLSSSVKQSRVDSYTRIAELWTQWTQMVAASEDGARLFYNGTQDFEALDPSERARFHQFLSMYYGIVDTLMIHDRAGTSYDKETYERHKNEAYALFKRPGVYRWWQINEGRSLSPNIEAYVWQRHREDMAKD
tara:strand:+ start:186 stop:662 length:477 start_codon:yes stop_codon:yes gene_type:complete